MVDAAGGFQLGASGRAGHGGGALLHGKIVQQDALCAGGQRFVKLSEAFRFHLDRQARIECPRPLQGGGDGAGRGDVVFLDEIGVEQAHAVVAAAAAADGVFLGKAQAGNGFAGVQQLRPAAFDERGPAPGAGGGAG